MRYTQMPYWLVDYPLTTILFVSSLSLLCYSLWLRYRMAVSKARFALAAIATLASCLFAFLAFMSGPLPVRIVHAASSLLGLKSVATITDAPSVVSSIIGGIIAVVALACIYAFSIQAIWSWEGPNTLSVHELAKQERDNNLAALALMEARRLVNFRADPVISNAAVNWQQKQSEAPQSPSWHLLSRSLFEASSSEALFTDASWRDRFHAWVGRIYVSDSAETVPLILFVFDEPPTDDGVRTRVDSFTKDASIVSDAKLFAVYNDDSFAEERLLDYSGLTVRILSRLYLLRSGLRLTDYARDLIRRFDVEPLGGTTASLKDTFMECHVCRPGSSRRIPLSIVLNDWLVDTSRRHLAITGEYGQGKSTAMLNFCAEWAKRYLRGHAAEERVPLLIELRGKNPAEVDPLAFLSAWGGRYGLPPKHVFNLIKAGKAVVIFEGFDELRNAGRAYDRHEHFNSLWRMAYPGSKLVFTGRPNFFLDEREKNRTLRADHMKGASGDAFTELWEIDRLTPTEINSIVNGFGDALGHSIMAAALAHPAFLEIVSRPSMLPVVATIWDDIGRLQGQGHDLTSAVLLEHYLQAVYKRKEAEIKKDQIQDLSPEGASYLLLPREFREVFTLALVWKMAGSDARNTITRRTFDSVIDLLFDDVFAGFQKENAPAHLIRAAREFEERFRDESRRDKVERISNEVASAGLFVPDPAGGPSNLRLPHKQFYEYLIAKSCYAVLKYPKMLIPTLIQSVDRKKNPFGRMLGEDLSIVFFSEIIGADYTIFRNKQLYVQLYLSIFGAHLQRLVAYLGSLRLAIWFKRKNSATEFPSELGSMVSRSPGDVWRARTQTYFPVFVKTFSIGGLALLSALFLYLPLPNHIMPFFAGAVAGFLGILFMPVSEASIARLSALTNLVCWKLRYNTDVAEDRIRLYKECILLISSSPNSRLLQNISEGSTKMQSDLLKEFRELIAPPA